MGRLWNISGAQTRCKVATRLRRGGTEEFGAWSRRPLEDREVVYMWADGIQGGLIA